MIGRATRLCDPIGKSYFRIFDAVGIYNTLQPFSQMRPVVVNPKISFSQLIHEQESTEGEDCELLGGPAHRQAAPQEGAPEWTGRRPLPAAHR